MGVTRIVVRKAGNMTAQGHLSARFAGRAGRPGGRLRLIRRMGPVCSLG
jgi:hypothetical protein